MDDITLSWYVQYLSYTFESHASVVNYLSGVKTLHVLLNASLQGFSGLLVRLTVRGLRKDLQCYPKQALAINPVILNRMYFTLNHDDPLDATFWALSLVSFFLLFRKSNTVADTLTQNTDHMLHRQDLTFRKSDVLVLVRWSKTNQHG